MFKLFILIIYFLFEIKNTGTNISYIILKNFIHFTSNNKKLRKRHQRRTDRSNGFEFPSLISLSLSLSLPVSVNVLCISKSELFLIQFNFALQPGISIKLSKTWVSLYTIVSAMVKYFCHPLIFVWCYIFARLLCNTTKNNN